MSVQRRFLLGSRWTARRPLPESEGERHFEVVGVAGDTATLRAVLTRRAYAVPIAALSDAAMWARGWQSLPG